MNVEAGHARGGIPWRDFLEVLYTPSSVFERRRDEKFVVALVFVTLATCVLSGISLPILEPVFQAEWSRWWLPGAASSDPELAAELERKYRLAYKLTPLFMLVFAPVGVVFGACLVWLVGRVVGGWRESFRMALVVSVYAGFPLLVKQVFDLVQGLFMDLSSVRSQYALSLGPARLLDLDTVSPLVLGLVAGLDVFTLWQMVLIAVGLRVTGRISPQRAALATSIVWLITPMLMSLEAAFRQA